MVIIKPWRISRLLTIVGLVWPPYLVLADRLEGSPWWQVLIGTAACGTVALGVGHLLRRLEERWSWRPQIVMSFGLLMSGGFFGAVIAFFVAPFSGQFGLMPSAAVLGFCCLAFNRAVDYGFTGFTMSYHSPRGAELRFSAGDDVQG